MLLFERDIENYPHAVLDTDSNPSFTRFSALLREMKIKNHLFPLFYTRPYLVGKDPFDPNIDPQLAIEFALEYKDNPFAFFRTCARDPAGTPEFPIQFSINRGISAMYFLFFSHITPYVVMIRQTGKSFGLDWLYTYLLNIRLSKTEISHLTKDEKLRGRELERLKAMELTLPPCLKQRGARDPGNTEVLKVSSLDNYFKAYLPNKSPKIADIIGRGMTSPIIGVDEFAYIFNNFITVPVMLSATLAAREVQKIKGDPYGNIFATTSGKRDTPEGRYAYKMISESAVWSDKYYDADNVEHLQEIVRAASPSKRLIVNCTFNHRQLGKPDSWLKQRLEDAIQEDPVQVRADYFNEWPSGTLTSPFSQDVANAIRNSEVLDNYVELVGKSTCYSLRWYYEESKIQTALLEPHVLAVDPSDGIGRDAIGNVLRNAVTGEVAFSADISESNLISYCQWLVDFIVENTNVTVIIERRGQGATIIDYLLMYLPTRGVNPFLRLYNKVVQEKEEYPERYREAMKTYRPGDPYTNPKFKQYFGWATSASGATSRAELYSTTLMSAAKMTGSQVKDRKLILQLLGLTIKNGRVDHEEGEHDDLAICWLLTYWLLSKGKNLREYGIDSHRILSNNPTYIESLKVKSGYEQAVNARARRDVEELSEAIKNEPDEYVARRLEYDLISALGKLSEQDRQIVAADDLLNKLREERSVNNRRSAYADTRAVFSALSYGGGGGYYH